MIPHITWLRMIAAIPAITRTAAMIQRIVSVVCSFASWARTAIVSQASVPPP